MARSRREFLARGSMGLVGAVVATKVAGAQPAAVASGAQSEGQSGQAEGQAGPEMMGGPQAVPGAPGAFGTAPATGPVVTVATFREAEKLVQVEMTPKEMAEAAGNWRQSMAALYERRVGPRKLPIPEGMAPATVWSPQAAVLKPGEAWPVVASVFVRETVAEVPLPGDDEAIAFAPVKQLSRWIETKQITSERLTKIYLERLERHTKVLHCVITLTPDHALEQARAADAEIAAGRYRGPLHGIPWGAKDLLDTAGIRTTWGAEPYERRIPMEDATVTKRLNDAGAVLVAKLSLGALALNDVWFGGQTKNPWNLDEGSSGSSAGPAAAVAAGLVGFAIGSETQGSLVSPSMRCGVTGLRPTYGRVPLTGAMTLSWTSDKLGPMARGVEDTMLVLKAIEGPDGKDAACVAAGLDFDATKGVEGLRLGYFPAWMKTAPATEVDRSALETVRRLGMVPVEVSLPDWPYDSLNIILFAESAGAFEALTLSREVDELKMQTPDAWPNTFRQSRFLSAVDLVQAERLRRMAALEMARVMGSVDLLLVPSLRDEFLVITNLTGQPSLTLRAGYVEVSESRSDWAPDPKHPAMKYATPRRVPHGVTLVGPLFGEGMIGRAGIAMEAAFGVAAERPRGF